MRQDIGSDMFIVRSGQVKIISSGSDGKEVILALLTPGDFFGELSLLDSGPRSARAVASEKDTELLLLQRYDFMALLQKYPSVMQAVFKVLAQRFAQGR
jgi:CRP/FNR family cyclic AMP-dependent transcriptional regulator